MRAGLLQHNIEVWKPEMVTNEYGEVEETMVKAYSTRARLIHRSGSKTIENREVVYPYNFTFEVYRYNIINENDQIRHNGKKYDILSIMDLREENKLVIETVVENE